MAVVVSACVAADKIATVDLMVGYSPPSLCVCVCVSVFHMKFHVYAFALHGIEATLTILIQSVISSEPSDGLQIEKKNSRCSEASVGSMQVYVELKF